MTWAELLNNPILNVSYKIDKDKHLDQNGNEKIPDAIYNASKAYFKYLSTIVIN